MHTLKRSQIGVEVQNAAIEKIKNDISLNVVNSYLQALFAEEQVKIAEAQVKISENQVNRIKELVAEGVLPKGDLLSIQSTFANDNQSLIIAENSLNMAALRLAQLLQLPESFIEIEDIDIDGVKKDILQTQSSAVYKRAVETFPEIKLAELNIKSAEESIKIAQGNYYPSLSLGYGLNTAYQHLMGTPDFISFSDQLNNTLGHSIFLSLNVPIFNRYQFKTNEGKALLNHKRVQYNLETEKLRLKETVQIAYTDAIASSKAYDAAIQSLESQKMAFAYANERYSEGVINSFDFNQAKNLLLIAESQLINAKYDFVFKLKVLEFYFGGSLRIE